jgi:hypothetical protein
LTFRMGAHGWCSSSCSCCICQWTVPSINGCCTLMETNLTHGDRTVRFTHKRNRDRETKRIETKKNRD